MIKKIGSKERYYNQSGWLSTYHLFSFADYYDEENMDFGVLRVFNDDTIDGENGFGAHGHKNMEIVTIILDGQLSHKDSMGNSSTMKKGEVQYMSAGTGVVHAEINEAKEPVHLYQIWLHPKNNNLTPAYAQKEFTSLITKNILVPVISDKELAVAISFQADATIFKSVLEDAATISYSIDAGRGVFMYVTKGSVNIGGQQFIAGDQARIIDEKEIVIMGEDLESEFVLIDVLL